MCRIVIKLLTVAVKWSIRVVWFINGNSVEYYGVVMTFINQTYIKFIIVIAKVVIESIFVGIAGE